VRVANELRAQGTIGHDHAATGNDDAPGNRAGNTDTDPASFSSTCFAVRIRHERRHDNATGRLGTAIAGESGRPAEVGDGTFRRSESGHCGGRRYFAGARPAC